MECAEFGSTLALLHVLILSCSRATRRVTDRDGLCVRQRTLRLVSVDCVELFHTSSRFVVPIDALAPHDFTDFGDLYVYAISCIPFNDGATCVFNVVRFPVLSHLFTCGVTAHRYEVPGCHKRPFPSTPVAMLARAPPWLFLVCITGAR